MDRQLPASTGAISPVRQPGAYGGKVATLLGSGRYDSDAAEGFQPHEAWLILVRSRWLILGVVAGMLVLTAFFTWRQQPVYESVTTLRIDDTGASLNPLSELGTVSGGGTGVIETELVVLQSRHIAAAVVDSLGLHVQLLEPDAPRSGVLRVLKASRDAVPGQYVLNLQKDGSYVLDNGAAAQGAAGAMRPARAEIGRPVQIGNVTLALSPALADELPSRIQFAIRPFDATVRQVQREIAASRANPKAQIVRVRYESTDPVLAAAVPNAAAASFMEYKNQTSRSESSSAVTFLREQVASYERQLRDAESSLRSYREGAQVVNPTEEASQQVRRLAELQAQRDALQAERNALAKLLSTVGPRRDGQPSPYRQLASFPVFLSNQAIQNILRSLTELENQRAQLLVLRTEQSRDVQGLDRRIEELELQLYQTATNYLESLDSQLASLEANLARFGDQLKMIPAREVQFARLSREAGLLEDLYTLLQTRLKEAEIRNAVEPGDVRVIDVAAVPESPISPKPVRNMVLGGLLGLMLGIGAAFGRQVLDTKVRSREDVHQATGGMPVLGLIPHLSMLPNGGRRNMKVLRAAPPMSPRDALVTRSDPRGVAAEAYRALRTNLTFANIERVPQVTVVTSALPGDGKSTSAANLATALAQQGQKVLLVDADLRRGLLHQLFEVRREPGLTNVLLGMRELRDAVQTVEVSETGETLSFLPTGVYPPNPAELVGSQRMRKLLEELREEYEAIIFDCPPLNLVTDGALLGSLADTTILVVRTGATDRRAVQYAAMQLQQVQASVGGVIINDISTDGNYYGYSYGAYAAEPSTSANGVA